MYVLKHSFLAFNTQLIKESTHPLHPIIEYNVYAISITAAAGTNLTCTFFSLDIIILHAKTVLQYPSSLLQLFQFTLSCIDQNSTLLPYV